MSFEKNQQVIKGREPSQDWDDYCDKETEVECDICGSVFNLSEDSKGNEFICPKCREADLKNGL